MKKLFESYEWVKIPDNLPKENLVMCIAKTTKTTIHAEDKDYPARIFKPEELKDAARSLAQRPIGINHMSIIEGAFVVDANWNDIDQSIEALLFVPTYFMRKIKEGIINKVSVEYTWREEEKTKEGTVFKGFVFNRVDLLERINAGDSNTEIRPVLMEGKKALMEGIIEDSGETELKQKMITAGIDTNIEAEAMEFIKHLGEPFAGYKDFADCVAKNKDKSDPEAYCGYIKHKVEDPKKKEEGSVLAKIPAMEVKEANLKGKQVPEETNPMASEPTPLTAIHAPLPQPMNPSDKVTSIGAIADNKGPITFESKESKEGDKLDKNIPVSGEPVLNIISNATGTKVGIESEKKPEEKKEEKKVEEPKKEEVKQEPVKELDKPKVEEKPKEEPKKEEPKPVEQPKVETSKVEEKKPIELPKIDARDVKITELEESIKKLQEAEKKRKEEIEKAKKEAKKEVIDKIEKTLPDSNIISNFNRGGRILAEDIKRVIYKEKKECE
jgi:hypothetical protein